jgi:hypothetical protein
MKRLLSILLVSLFALLSLSACGGAQGEPIRIGLLAYLEGEAMTINSSGQPTLNGAQLAVDQINASGGLRWTVIQTKLTPAGGCASTDGIIQSS